MCARRASDVAVGAAAAGGAALERGRPRGQVRAARPLARHAPARYRQSVPPPAPSLTPTPSGTVHLSTSSSILQYFLLA